MNRTARIAQLRESIARSALAATLPGVPDGVRILDVHRVRDVFIVATENPADRWASHYVETFRIPTADNTDPYYGEGQAPKAWVPLASWKGYAIDEIPDLIEQAIHYVNHDLVA
ncbi:hypothetical protein OG785_45555 [Streptomyces sp. NBC_00006]|uniref:hypothetical protein n=1 Tax=Streptomyces sp. NBC_00006 TaxID=2975619 RepID=UPI0022527F75|nr:hypothetical protein [Streptomyces sp. NBC_00006]MCX5537827.1 hypothetical protein [Streptomyces sp. NBC_00006]